MNILRTPDECFDNLADYDFQPHYLEIGDSEGGELRLHYLDEGPADGKVVLLMHGQPTWSYLYRRMIPGLVAAGHRVIAPDLVGFGKSDKPASRTDYSYARHVSWMSEWLTALDLNDLYLFCQDWGGLIGLRLVAAYPERFAGVAVSNTGLPVGMIPEEFTEALKEADKTLPLVHASELGARFRDTSGIPGFLYWRKYCSETPELVIAEVMRFAADSLSDETLAAYNAPFPDGRFMMGARQFPSLVPVFKDDVEVPANQKAWDVLAGFDKPFLVAFSDGDPVTAGGDATFLDRVRGCEGVAHRTIKNGGHFIQEDQPQACVQAILDLIAQV